MPRSLSRGAGLSHFSRNPRRPETIEGLDARTAEECTRTGYSVTRTDLVRRVLAIVARDPEALQALLERE